MMQYVEIQDKTFQLYIRSSEIQKRVAAIAEELNKRYTDSNPIFLIVMNGAFFFAADLLGYITFSYRFETIKLKSYEGLKSLGEVEKIDNVPSFAQNDKIIIIEDIIESGLTIDSLLHNIEGQELKFQPEIVCLFDKPLGRTTSIRPNKSGFALKDEFVVGYGLDYNNEGRSLPDIYKLVDHK